MKIRTVCIHNWRSIEHIDIAFERMMVFIGQNNHGKSNILTALLFFFGEINCDSLDYREGSDEAYVEVVFDELDETDKKTFQKYVGADETITVRREASKSDGKCEYHGYIEEPTEEWLKSDNATNYTRRADAETTPLNAYLPDSGRLSKDAILDAQRRYIAEHRDKLHFSRTLETSNFLGAKSVAKGIWGDIFFIPAVKKASDELSTKSTTVFNQLYSRVLNAMSENSEEFKNAKREMSALIRRLNKHTEDGGVNEERPGELTQFEALLGDELSDWNTKIDVEVTPPDVDSILRIGTNVWIDDGTRTDITRKGQGLQRALIFALVKALAKLSLQDTAGEEVTRRASKSTYFILEEPELYLHPQAQRALFASLNELSNTAQVIMCTHSGAFLSLDWYKSICRVEKSYPNAPTHISQCTVDLFGEADDKKQFNMVYWINPDRSELFFAKKVVLLEGPTDKTVLPRLAKELGVYRHDFTLIDCGSKNAMPQYINLLNYFRIPYVAVYDKDHQAEKDQQAKDSADSSSKKIEDKISSHLGESIVFENDIEEELGLDAGAKNKPYLALQHLESPGFSISGRLKAKIDRIFA